MTSRDAIEALRMVCGGCLIAGFVFGIGWFFALAGAAFGVN